MLKARGIDQTYVETDPEHPTGTVTVTLTGTEHRFTIHAPASWDFIEGPQRLPVHDVFCYGSLVGRNRRSLEALTRLLEASAAVKALDVNLRADNDVEAALHTGLRHADIVKAGTDEFAAVSAAQRIAASTDDWFATWPALRWLAITHGPGGAELHGRDGGAWRLPGARVDVVDTVGAGDAFFAGLVDALMTGVEGEAALEAAQANAVRIVRQRGGLPPAP